MDDTLTPTEIRVLGALLEKEATTPEYYPLTLNALLLACNQKSNRWPVTEYADDDILAALEGLRARGFAASILGNGRVTKYAQRYTEKLNLGRREVAILCVLFLRGQQTVGEIKGRTERLHDFESLDEVEMVLAKLGGMVRKLLPAPGMKEPRWVHTLGGVTEQTAAAPAAHHTPGADRMTALEAEVARLSAEVAELRRRLDEVL